MRCNISQIIETLFQTTERHCTIAKLQFKRQAVTSSDILHLTLSYRIHVRHKGPRVNSFNLTCLQQALTGPVRWLDICCYIYPWVWNINRRKTEANVCGGRKGFHFSVQDTRERLKKKKWRVFFTHIGPIQRLGYWKKNQENPVAVMSMNMEKIPED